MLSPSGVNSKLGTRARKVCVFTVAGDEEEEVDEEEEEARGRKS